MLATITDSQRDYLGFILTLTGLGFTGLALFLWINWAIEVNKDDNKGDLYPGKLILALLVSLLVIGILVGTFFLIGADVRVTK